jgi:hypothetical protein
MRRLWSWTGAVFAAVHALAFTALYIEYIKRSGAWFADLPLSLAALPFTLVMRPLNGGSFDFGGAMTGRVIAAAGIGLARAASALMGRAYRPSISIRFCTAAPDAPLPRLSNFATKSACPRASFG